MASFCRFKAFQGDNDRPCDYHGAEDVRVISQRPLPDRYHIVLSKGAFVGENGQVKVVPDVESALACIPTGQEAFVIGGGQVYRQFLPYCQQAYVTDVKGVFDADVFFPELAVEEWDCVEEGSWQKDEKSGLEYRFMIYRRKENA